MAVKEAKTKIKDTDIKPKPVKDTDVYTASHFPIVGIGASAGGLAAYSSFFSAMPATTESGMAIVIVQHLSPDHASMLTDLIKRYTKMAVHEVTNGIKVERNSVYIIPPSKDMTFKNGKLHLTEPVAQRGFRLPIDFFFNSLAEDQQERAICVILSGTGSDGTLGAREIKGNGGLVIAQTPESSEYDGMPQSIIRSGLADYILSPEEMPALLINFAAHSIHLAPMDETHPRKQSEILNKIFILVKSKTGHDFANYKPQTILRRLERRLTINKIGNLEDYYHYMQSNKEEIDILFHDFLIGVTSFFRDKQAFNDLQETALPLLFANKPVGSNIRVWIPACSTGEEAYTIAIMLYEYNENLPVSYGLQIFATDLDEKSIEQARRGVYPLSISNDIKPERLNRFFTLNQEKQQFQVHKNIREIILFSVQNIIKDPPYSKIDLISCRNILIYLNTDLHKKLIPLLHYSLNENGILFLGTSESIGEFTDLFHPLVRNSKVYQRKGKPSPQKPIASVLSSPENQVYYPADKPMNIEQKKISLKDLAEAELLTRYAPAAVIINADGEAVYFHGRTGKYLEPAPGVAGTKLVRMARPGLQNELENAIFRATISKKETIYPNLKVKTNGTYTLINLTVKALELSPEWKMQTDTHLYIVIFEEVPIAFPEAVEKLTGKESIKKNSDLINKIANLEQELRSKDTYLQSTLEEMETSTEEMKSTNEEMQSMNEELQSTNEELETSREELQSVNEELTTVNSELHVKIQNLSKAEDDFNNLLGSTGIGTIFVNLQQLIQRYTPSVTKIIKLIKSDVGRHVGDIVTNLINYDTLTEDIQTVLDTLVPLERDVQSKNDAWYLLRIVPYRTLENVIDGAVITFVDITLHKTADKVLQEYEALKRLTAVVRDASDAVIMQDLNGKILAWNPAAEKMYGYSEAEALVMNTYDIIPASLKKSTHSIYNNLNSMPLNPFNSRRICQDGKIMPVLVTATALINDKGDVYAIATTEKSKSV